MDLLYRYSRLADNGYKSGLDLTMKTILETLRAEVHRLERLRSVQRSIRTQRKMLVSLSSGAEYCNKKFSPYKLALDGWSGEVLENIGDYDEVFEELHDKYTDTMNFPPELRLVMMVGGSGLMFHLSNTLFKSSTPQLNDILQNNPELMAQVQQEALRSMASNHGGDPVFNMMMHGVNEKKRQQAQQAPWGGRPGYRPPRTSGFQHPEASNSGDSVGVNLNQVPRGQGLVNQKAMEGPDDYDAIISQLNVNNTVENSLVSDIESDVKTVKRKSRKKKNNGVIDLN